MKELHKQKIQEMFDNASMIMAEGNTITPIFFIVKENVFNGILSKDNWTIKQYKDAVIKMAEQMDADAIIAVCEQFMVTLNKKDQRLQDLLDGKIRPSEQPDKEEYLTVIYIQPNGESESIIGKIHQNLSSQVRYIKDSKWISNPRTNLFSSWGSAVLPEEKGIH